MKVAKGIWQDEDEDEDEGEGEDEEEDEEKGLAMISELKQNEQINNKTAEATDKDGRWWKRRKRNELENPFNECKCFSPKIYVFWQARGTLLQRHKS